MKKSKKNTETESVNPATGSTPPSVISDAEIETCLQHLQAVTDVLAPYAITLTTAQRRSATRLRKGGEKVIPLMRRLAISAGVQGTAFDVDAMQNQLDLATALIPLLTRAKTVSDAIGDTVLSANGKAWSSATTLHHVLKRVSQDKPEMRRDMEVVSKAFSVQRTAAKSATKAPVEIAPTPNGQQPAEQAPPGPPADAQPAKTA
jgi:hypothetical protein